MVTILLFFYRENYVFNFGKPRYIKVYSFIYNKIYSHIAAVIAFRCEYLIAKGFGDLFFKFYKCGVDLVKIVKLYVYYLGAFAVAFKFCKKNNRCKEKRRHY